MEGIDGSGKSTQIELLQKWLESEGYVTFFSEWNSSPLVREVTRRGKKKRMLTPMTFSLIHATDFADRTEHHIMRIVISSGCVCPAMSRKRRYVGAEAARLAGQPTILSLRRR